LRGIITVQLHPTLRRGIGVGDNGAGGALRLTHAAVNALIGMDNQHIFALKKAIDGTNADAIHVFATDAGFGNDIGHDADLLKK
jgi:hypothetical protein